MKNLLSRLQRDEDGAAMVEYAVILRVGYGGCDRLDDHDRR